MWKEDYGTILGCVLGVMRGMTLPDMIMASSAIDKMFEIDTFYENRTESYILFENRFEIYTCILCKNRTENFEHFVNGR